MAHVQQAASARTVQAGHMPYHAKDSVAIVNEPVLGQYCTRRQTHAPTCILLGVPPGTQQRGQAPVSKHKSGSKGRAGERPYFDTQAHPATNHSHWQQHSSMHTNDMYRQNSAHVGISRGACCTGWQQKCAGHPTGYGVPPTARAPLQLLPLRRCSHHAVRARRPVAGLPLALLQAPGSSWG